MPYTRHTRIKVVHKKNNRESTAQVLYRYPLTKFTKWVNFEDSMTSLVPCFLGIGSVAWEGYKKALWNNEHEKKKGIEWAKAIIEEYHTLIDEEQWVDVIQYVDYPIPVNKEDV